MNKKAQEDAEEKRKEKVPEKKEKSRPNGGEGPTQNIINEFHVTLFLSSHLIPVDGFVYFGDFVFGDLFIIALRCTCEDDFNYGDTLKRRVGPLRLVQIRRQTWQTKKEAKKDAAEAKRQGTTRGIQNVLQRKIRRQKLEDKLNEETYDQGWVGQGSFDGNTGQGMPEGAKRGNLPRFCIQEASSCFSFDFETKLWKAT